MATVAAVFLLAVASLSAGDSSQPVPEIDGDWWQIAGQPDLGRYTREKQQPVDFAIWQASDGTWQLWSCIRHTGCGGHSRLFYRWEAARLTDAHWRPMGIAMEADTALGEQAGGLQAPHVVCHQGQYTMAYGDWENICLATSTDGKNFRRVIQPGGRTGVFSEGAGCNTRDAMLISINGLWHCYYTASHPERGYVYCRTSSDLKTWSPSVVVSYGGQAGTGPWQSECPHVVEPRPGVFYLFRNQVYGQNARNFVYRSGNPLNFGIDDDSRLVRSWHLAAPEILRDKDQWFVASLTDQLDGIKLARLKWVERAESDRAPLDADASDSRQPGQSQSATPVQPPLQRVRVADDGRRFVLAESNSTFVPWGFNYDHDAAGRLLEDYWRQEWPRVEEDFVEMRQLGANVVRIHLQLGRFMNSAGTVNPDALAQLWRLVELAERERLYLDLTGLGCYHKQDVPAWYDAQTEDERWETQAKFWEAVAERCAGSPAIFCYDLMNEPVVPGPGDERSDWLGPPFAGKHFVQFITRKLGDRQRPAVALAWINHLVAAIDRHDRDHLITVGLVPWSLDRPGLTSGFVPREIAAPLDFLSVHVYPERSKIDEALQTLAGFDVGKPVLVEETFPLRCSLDEFESFLDQSQAHAAGWIGFYWGKTRQACRQSHDIGDKLMLGWLDQFAAGARPQAAP